MGNTSVAAGADRGRRLSRPGVALVWAVAVSGIGLIAGFLMRQMRPADIPPLIGFMVAYGLVARTTVRLPSGARFSSAAIILTAAVTGLGPLGALVVIPGNVARYWRERDWSWRLAYTCGQMALSSMAGAALFAALGGRFGQPAGPADALRALGFIVGYDTVNSAFASARVALETGEAWAPTWLRLLIHDRGTAQWLYYLLAVASALLWAHDRWVGLTLTTALGFFLYMTLQQSDMATRRAEEARTDTLTGLGNRRRLLEWAPTAATSPCGLLLIDLDRFKSINDRHGHDAGDAALVAAAQVLREQTRADDVLVRYGGDEFVVVLPGATRADAVAASKRIAAAMADRSLVTAGQTVMLRASIGVAATPEDGAGVAELLRSADGAMYASKSMGQRRSGSA